MITEIKSRKTEAKKRDRDTSQSALRVRSGESSRFVSGTFSPDPLAMKGLDKKGSKSLTDLTRQMNNVSTSSKGSEASTPRKRSSTFIGTINATQVTGSTGNSHGNKLARRCILNLLMLNAWRKQKHENKLMVEKMVDVNKKVEGFEMQVYVLRQLLNAEKDRLDASKEKTSNLLQKLEESSKNENLIIEEKEELEKNVNDLVKYCSQLEDALKNQENDIITSRLEVENWERQLKKEREKLKKMENEESVLKEKILLNEKVITAKSHQLEQMIEANKELQQKLDVQIPLWDETMAQVDLANAKLKESENVRAELQKVLEGKDKEIKKLNSTVMALEKKLQDEDERNGLLGKMILEKTNDLTLMEQKLAELSKSQNPWSGGILRMASICAKIPVACICTVGSLLLPFPSYRI